MPAERHATHADRMPSANSLRHMPSHERRVAANQHTARMPGSRPSGCTGGRRKQVDRSPLSRVAAEATVPERQQRLTQQDQWGPIVMSSRCLIMWTVSQLAIERSNRRSHRDPDQEEPDEKTRRCAAWIVFA